MSDSQVLPGQDKDELAEIKAKATTSLDRAMIVVGHAISLLFVIGVIISFYEVILRYLFNAPTIWVHETMISLVAIGFAFAGSYTLARREHIRISVIYDLFPDRMKRFLDGVNDLLALAYFAGIGYGAFVLAEKSVGLMEGTGTAWNPPYPPIIKSVLVLSIGLMALQVILHFIQRLRNQR